MTELVLPWPPRVLSPNARVHWSVKSKAAKLYRSQCYWICKQSGLVAPETDGRLHLWIDFYPPDRRRRDDDNIAASFKSARDGIADAIGIDDNRFVCHPWLKDETGGVVKVRITAGPDGF